MQHSTCKNPWNYDDLKEYKYIKYVIADFFYYYYLKERERENCLYNQWPESGNRFRSCEKKKERERKEKESDTEIDRETWLYTVIRILGAVKKDIVIYLTR